MGVMGSLFNILFGGGRNVIRDTAEVFVENREAGAVRDVDLHRATLEAYAAEFMHPQKGMFDRFMDGLNRLPRPALALGTLGLFTAAMVDPIWFASRMQGISLVPDPLWWLLGAIVSFYFGARHQAKGQEFQRSIATTLSRTDEVRRTIEGLTGHAAAGQSPPPSTPLSFRGIAGPKPALKAQAVDTSGNAALVDWVKSRGRTGGK